MPCSSYSAFDIHICWKEPRLAKIDPPIHTLNLRSTALAGLVTFTLLVAASATCVAACAARSRSSLSLSPGSRAVPPERTTLA